MLGRDFRLRTQRTLEGLGFFTHSVYWDFKAAHSYLYPQAKQELYTSGPLFSFLRQTLLRSPHLKMQFYKGKNTKNPLLLRNAYNDTFFWHLFVLSVMCMFISFIIKNAFRARCNLVPSSFCLVDLCQRATHLKNTVCLIYGTIHLI